jgi:trehalose/maltose hydrolase-like predicted phosphorylase
MRREERVGAMSAVVGDDLPARSRGSAFAHNLGVATLPGSPRDFPALRRTFRLVICDWDGPAGVSDGDDASVLAHLVEPLLASGLWLILVTHTDFETIDRQFCDLLMSELRRHVVVCANRGSEAFGFDEHGHVASRFRRVTSREAEVELTGEVDAVHWVKHEIIEPLAIEQDAVLIVGDAFGSIGGVAGPAARLRSGLEQAVTVSVGVEPEGVPSGVIHLGGGPRVFRGLLAYQLALRCADVAAGNGEPLPPEFASDERLASVPALGGDAIQGPEWELAVQGMRPELEHVVESWLTVGNGFLGVRGALDDPHPSSRPRTLVAGLFGPVEVPGQIPPQVPGLVAAPNWTRLRLVVDGEPVAVGHPEQQKVGALTRVLDMRRAILHSDWSQAGTAGTVTVESMRLVSQVRRHIGIQIVRITASQPATVVLQAWLDPSTSGLVQQRDRDTGSAVGTLWHTTDERWWLGCATAASASAGNGQVLDAVKQDSTGELERQTWAWDATPGSAVTFIRIVAMARNRQPERARQDAVAYLEEARGAGMDVLLDEHVRAWRRLWAASDVGIDGDSEAQRLLRFATYHLLSAANPLDEHVSIGARGLTGDGYLGHVFWDTDTYLIPFFTFAWPAAARALLMYRYHTLPAARQRAVQLGHTGALYAWESADTGGDVTPTGAIAPNGQQVTIATGTQEQHISADIAYAVWHYWQATRDVPFLLTAGAEIVLETARFWASRCALESDGLYHIRQIIGPDEYHEGVDDDAYTNGMARQNLIYGLSVARLLRRRRPQQWQMLVERLRLAPGELDRWHVISTHMAVVTHRNRHDLLIEQFQGYFGLEQIDISAYSNRTVPMDVILGQERTRRSQVIKQPDVVMLQALLPDQFTPREVAANYHYYEPRCGQGSSLSPGIHAVVAARLGELAIAERYFRETTRIDLNDTTGTAARGLHMAALGSLWLTVVYGFVGISPRTGALHLDPHLPDGWTSLTVPLQWHGRELEYRVERDPLRVSVRLGAGSTPVAVSVGALHARLSQSGERWDCWWDRVTHTWKEGSP